MCEKYPLYPGLPEEGGEVVQKLMDSFTEKMTKICEETLSNLYTEISCHVEGDHWTNYRNELMEGFQDYGNRMVQGEHDFKKIRQQIFKDYREDIIKDLNQDLLDEIVDLKTSIDRLQDLRRL